MAYDTALASAIATQNGIPPNLFNALIMQESGGDPTAQSKKSSAYGLTQLVQGTAQQVGVTDITDPTQQMQGGASYLASMFSRFGNWTQALEAYNQGPNGNLSAGAGYASSIMNNASGDVTTLANNLAGMSTTDEAASAPAAQIATAAASSVSAWFQSKAGDVAIVVLGVVVIGIALMSHPRSAVIIQQAAKGIK